jgi:hypothetical protein
MKITISWEVDAEQLRAYLESPEGQELQKMLARLRELKPEEVRAIGQEPEVTWQGWGY